MSPFDPDNPYNTDHLAQSRIKEVIEKESDTNSQNIAGTISEQNERMKKAFFDIPKSI